MNTHSLDLAGMFQLVDGFCSSAVIRAYEKRNGWTKFRPTTYDEDIILIIGDPEPNSTNANSASPYSTWSLNKTGNRRLEYAEDWELEMDFEKAFQENAGCRKFYEVK